MSSVLPVVQSAFQSCGCNGTDHAADSLEPRRAQWQLRRQRSDAFPSVAKPLASPPGTAAATRGVLSMRLMSADGQPLSAAGSDAAQKALIAACRGRSVRTEHEPNARIGKDGEAKAKAPVAAKMWQR